MHIWINIMIVTLGAFGQGYTEDLWPKHAGQNEQWCLCDGKHEFKVTSKQTLNPVTFLPLKII